MAVLRRVRGAPQADTGAVARYLAYCQEQALGINVVKDLPGHRREGDSVNGRKHDVLYMQCKAWLNGEDIDF